MSKTFAPPYAPKSLTDFVFGNKASKQLIEGIFNGGVPFPSNKCAICLYGAYGSGKTALARLLPKWLETSGHLPVFPRHDNGFAPSDWETFTECGIPANTSGISQELAQRVHHHMRHAPTGWHYETLDEADQLTVAAQSSLKSLMDPRNGTIFILTTNHPDNLNGGVINRSHMIEMNYPSPQQYQQLGVSWLIREGFTGSEVSQAKWDQIIASCDGFRDLGDAVATLIETLRAQPTAMA